MPKSKNIGKRIKFNRDSNQISISINQRVKPWQEGVIFAWMAIWVICGFFFVSQYFISESEKQKLFIIAFLGFWLYLLFKAMQILIWRVTGSEDIVIQKGLLNYKKSYAGIGRVKKVEINSISNLGLVKYSEKSYKNSYESYFWSMGAEKIGFNSAKRHMIIGMQLDEKDAKLLLELINSGVKKFK
ncbi:MAG: hypothetical protein QNL21_01125 [Flavobacteriales bacterium]